MLDDREREKINKIYAGGRTRYIIRHGMVNWGLSTGFIFRVLSIISEEGLSLTAVIAGLPTMRTLIAMVIFSIFGAVWGAFFWKWIKKEALKEPEKPQGKKSSDKRKK